MLTIPRVDDWWRLTRAYPRYQWASNYTLKDYGYMKILEAIKTARPGRILEFGHGLQHAELFGHLEETSIEQWGVDDDQGLHYLPTGDAWDAAYEENLVRRYPHVTFRRGLLGDPETDRDLPQDHFDMVVSVSVLEEVSVARVREITRSSHGLLRRGGRYLGTHDIVLGDTARFRALIQVLGDCGFQVDPAACERAWRDIEVGQILLENPTVVMVGYQGDEGDDRRYPGHWTTVYFDCPKL